MRGCFCRVEPCSTHSIIARRAAEHGSALQKADPASRSVRALRGCVPQCQPRLAPTRATTGCSRSTPCVDASVESSHARLIPSSREEQPSMARLYIKQIPRTDQSTPCVDASVESSHARLIPSSREEQPSMARLYRKQIPRADQSAPCVDAFRSANQGWHLPGQRPAAVDPRHAWMLL